MTRLLFLLLFVLHVCSINNGLGRTPAMGYNTWNDFRCNISASKVKSVADAIVRQNLHKVGYVYVNMDDCWAVSRDSNGVVVADTQSFPFGIKDVADYVHKLGLKFGIYTDRGNYTCAGRPGTLGYEKIDAATYASWGVDYLKEDSCYASDDHNTAFQQYGKMRDALNATGRPIYFSLCGWNDWYAPPGATLGNSWRIAGDCNTWPDVLNAIDVNAPLAKYAGPGNWNDPDMLIGTSNSTAAYLTQDRSRAMFSMWCVMAAPLLIGSNVVNLNQFDLETFSNTEAIAVNQDPLGLQGIRLVGGPLTGSSPSLTNVWGRRLSDGSGALVFLNNDVKNQDIVCNSTCYSQMGLNSQDLVVVRDLWQHASAYSIVGSGIAARNVVANGGSVFLRITK